MELNSFIKKCASLDKGIKLAEPSNDIYNANMGMARESLKSMDINAKEGIRTWALSTAYYARYLALYAVFAKAGIKCEIHDCTLALTKFLSLINPKLMKEIESSKQHRTDVQYYADRTVSDNDYEKDISSAKNFVLEMEKLASKLTKDDINRIRQKLLPIMKRKL